MNIDEKAGFLNFAFLAEKGRKFPFPFLFLVR